MCIGGMQCALVLWTKVTANFTFSYFLDIFYDFMTFYDFLWYPSEHHDNCASTICQKASFRFPTTKSFDVVCCTALPTPSGLMGIRVEWYMYGCCTLPFMMILSGRIWQLIKESWLIYSGWTAAWLLDRQKNIQSFPVSIDFFGLIIHIPSGYD